MKVILASNSPRRRELFSKICPSFEILPADVDESIPIGTPPREAVKLLARRKAARVLTLAQASAIHSETPIIVLGSDTVVAYEDKILGKPTDEKDAFNMLKMLSGRTHFVYTGVCFSYTGGEKVAVDSSEVTFHRLTDEQILDYIATGSPMDKAGAYGIQDGGLVKQYTGSYTNIVGLPVELTERMYEEVINNVKNSN